MLCDLAEIYHIYNYKDFPVEYIATLCCGFPKNSRTIKRIHDQNLDFDELMLVNIVDRLSLIWWSKTKDAENNRNRPKLLCELLFENNEKPQNMVFASGEEFEAKRREIIEEKKNGGRC